MMLFPVYSERFLFLLALNCDWMNGEHSNEYCRLMSNWGVFEWRTHRNVADRIEYRGARQGDGVLPPFDVPSIWSTLLVTGASQNSSLFTVSPELRLLWGPLQTQLRWQQQSLSSLKTLMLQATMFAIEATSSPQISQPEFSEHSMIDDASKAFREHSDVVTLQRDQHTEHPLPPSTYLLTDSSRVSKNNVQPLTIAQTDEWDLLSYWKRSSQKHW